MDDNKLVLCYAVRHGTTDLNKSDSFRGPIDVSLDKKGYQDAHMLATLLEPVDVSYIFHSDLKRTRETAKIIADRKPDVEVFANPYLRAWNVGDLGGQPKSEENLRLVEYHVDHPDLPLPGGESLNQFKARIQPLIREACEIGMHSGVPPLLVVHSSVIHEISFMLNGDHCSCLVEPGGAVAIYLDKNQAKVDQVFKPRESANSRRGDSVT